MSARRGLAGGPGFTLLELLVVVGIVGLLAALILPALAEAKGKTRRLACLSRLHQWHREPRPSRP